MRLAYLILSLPLLAQFDYDQTAKLHARQEPLAERRSARLWGGSFAGPRATRINFVLVEPKTTGRHPAVLYQHGGGQSMSNYISEALILAERGVTSLILDVPAAESRESLVELVISERRALDLLLRQTGVDPNRIAYVGHSYGGLAGGVLSAVEPRIHAFILIGAVPSLARHIQESPSAYWNTIKSQPGYSAARDALLEIDAHQHLPRSRRHFRPMRPFRHPR